MINSESVWKELVVDAKLRGCFYNAEENKDLDKAITIALFDSEADVAESLSDRLAAIKLRDGQGDSSSRFR